MGIIVIILIYVIYETTKEPFSTENQVEKRDHSNRVSSNVVDTALMDPTGNFEIKIHKILVGQDCVINNVVHNYQLAEAHNKNKEIAYFEVSVKNLKLPELRHVSFMQFKLEDNEGYSYPRIRQ